MKLFILFLSIYGTALASQNLPKPYIKNELLILATPSFFLTTANIKTLQLSTKSHVLEINYYKKTTFSQSFITIITLTNKPGPMVSLPI